jgi:hypothetical protein
VTDGVVTFHVTQNKNNQLKINAQYGYFNNPDAIPEKFSIDFSVIKDAQGTQYYAVSFGNFSYQASYYFKAYADRLTEFIAPHLTGLFGNGCFGYCTGLTKVVLSNEFSSFADRSFYYCSALIDLTPTTFSKVTTKLNISSFAGCSKLPGGLSFPECTSAGGSIFQNCTSIDNISLPKLKNISEATFSGCSNLKTLELSPGVRYIGTGAFRDCTSLPGDFFRTLLDKDIEQLGNGNYNSGMSGCFLNCSSFDGALDWNFPNLQTIKIKDDEYKANIVGEAFFSGCTKLNRVNFITPVVEIRGAAFANIAPGAELYMPLAVPDVFGAQAIGNKTGDVYPKVYLKGNYEDWLAKMEENHYVVRKEKFNVWEGEYTVGNTTYKRKWAKVAEMMKYDKEMCTVDADNKVTLKRAKRSVLAFVLKRSNDGQVSSLYGFWVLKVPEKGLKVIVR